MKNLILSLTIVFFGNSIYNAQTTTKPTRTYTKKVEQSTNNTPTTKPTRTYATKEVTTNNSSNSVKPARTYATKPESNTTPIPKITENNSAKTEKVEPQTTAPKKESSVSWFSKIFGNSKKSNTKAQTTNETYKGHQVLIGPKGGKYYINKNGNKTYIK